jgi:hypothetical protein
VSVFWPRQHAGRHCGRACKRLAAAAPAAVHTHKRTDETCSTRALVWSWRASAKFSCFVWAKYFRLASTQGGRACKQLAAAALALYTRTQASFKQHQAAAQVCYAGRGGCQEARLCTRCTFRPGMLPERIQHANLRCLKLRCLKLRCLKLRCCPLLLLVSQAEEAVKSQGFARAGIFRPGMLSAHH